jgi:hypothetical protein
MKSHKTSEILSYYIIYTELPFGYSTEVYEKK